MALAETVNGLRSQSSGPVDIGRRSRACRPAVDALVEHQAPSRSLGLRMPQEVETEYYLTEPSNTGL